MTIEEAIRTGIEYETQVREVYAEAAVRFGDPVARRVLGLLASEEERHIEYLESRLAEWKQTGRVTAERLDTAVPSKEAIDASVKRLTKKMAPRDFTVELDMLKKALQLEIEATGFFRQMVSELRAEEQKLFGRFVEIEQGHEAIVQAEIDAITGLGFWFDYSEFRLEGA